MPQMMTIYILQLEIGNANSIFFRTVLHVCSPHAKLFLRYKYNITLIYTFEFCNILSEKKNLMMYCILTLYEEINDIARWLNGVKKVRSAQKLFS